MRVLHSRSRSARVRGGRSWRQAGVLIAALLACGRALAAQTAQTEFVPASQVPVETLPAAPLVFVAYAFVWVALVAYVFALWRKLGRVEREMRQVSDRLESRRRS